MGVCKYDYILNKIFAKIAERNWIWQRNKSLRSLCSLCSMNPVNGHVSLKQPCSNLIYSKGQTMNWFIWCPKAHAVKLNWHQTWMNCQRQLTPGWWISVSTIIIEANFKFIIQFIIIILERTEICTHLIYRTRECKEAATFSSSHILKWNI